jgi:DMSO/TMAO reductase YedYZ molybdopterin-dependent catalytic subunit
VTSIRPRSPRAALAGRGSVVGIVTALVSLGVAQLVAAALASPNAAPVDAVGAVSINNAPRAVKDFAISTFGSSDKTVLVWGIRVVLLILAAIVGILAVRVLWHGLVGLAVLTAIGMYAALTRPHATAASALPSLVGAAVAALAMRYFSELARRGLPEAAPPDRDRRPPGAAQPRQGQQPRTGSAPEAELDWTPGPTAEPGPAVGRDASGAGRRADRQPQARTPAGRHATGAGLPARTAAAAGQGPDRRKFLVSSAAVAAGSLVAYGGGSLLANSRDVSAAAKAVRLPRATTPAPPLPPGTDLKIPGLSSFITPNSKFYRVDTAIVLPEVLPSTWQLRVHGMVRKEIVISFAELLKRPMIEDYITLCCVSNPVGGPYISNAKWLGASLRSLLQEAGIKAGASQLLCTSSDGFTSGTPVETAMDGREALLAVGMNGTPLPVAHGFPVRLVIPGLYGYVSACKWLVDIDVTTYADAQAYWVPQGWSAQAPVKTESRIDVPGIQNSVTAGVTTPIAGVAWAQHKGIEAVEVRIAAGPWQQARLANVPGIESWRQWAYDWDANVRPGNYLVEARATDKTGYTQTSLAAPPPPNGASGYPSVLVSVT